MQDNFLQLFFFQKGTSWKIYVLVEYQSFTESLYIESDIYDLNAVVASVGGSLGLFIGFSCYEYGKRLIDSVPIELFKSRRSLKKTLVNSEVGDYLEENIKHIDGDV